MEIKKESIINYCQGVNLNAYLNAYNITKNLIENAMETITKRNSYITNFDIKIANEALGGTCIAESSLDIFVIIQSTQLEENFKSTFNNKFKNFTKEFFHSFIDNLKIIKRKKQSVKKLNKLSAKIENTTNYNVLTLYEDLNLYFIKNMPQSTKITMFDNRISLIDKSMLGINVNIYPVFTSYNDNQIYNLYNIKNGKCFEIDFRDRFLNYEYMYDNTNHMIQIQVRIFNNLYYNIFNSVPNQIFIESLMFNVPLELYGTSNIINTTINIINYLKNSTMQNFVSICDPDIKMFDEPLITTKPENAYKFINQIKIV